MKFGIAFCLLLRSKTADSFMPIATSSLVRVRVATPPLLGHSVPNRQMKLPTSTSLRSLSEKEARLSPLSSSSSSDKDTVETITTSSGSRITLIGTAHLSEASNAQVKRIIQNLQPDVVMVEMDMDRLPRIGYASLDDVGLPVVTADDIVPPGCQDSDKADTPIWQMPQAFLQKLLLDAIAGIARKLLTDMYNDASEGIKSEEGPGGEFKVSIETAKAVNAKRIVLGDRKSTITIRRTAELAFDSGDPWGVLRKFDRVNGEEMKKIENKLKEELDGTVSEDDKEAFTKAMIEKMKTDSTSRERLMDRLAEEVPEFSQAFLTERDYIMSKSIQREVDKGAKKIVGVVGLAHVPGIARNLRSDTAQ